MKQSASLQGDLVGGITSAVITLPVAIACGLLAFSALGAGYTSMAAKAGIYGAVFASIAGALTGSAPTQITGPKLSLTMILAVLVGSMVQMPPLPGPPSEQIPLILTLVFTAVFMAGLVQLLLGVFRIGHLIKYIPFSVLHGYLNAIALLIILTQVRFFIGTDALSVKALLHGELLMQLPTVIVAVSTVLIMVVCARFIPTLSGALPALLLGTILHLTLQKYVAPATLGLTIGHIPVGLPQVEFVELGQMAQVSIFLQNLPRLIGPALSMALLSSISTLLCVVIVDSMHQSRHGGNRELVSVGVCNMLLGGMGGLVCAGSASRTAINIEMGARSRLSAVVHGLFLLLVVTLLGPVVGKIPLSVVAAILMVTAVQMIMKSHREMGWKSLREAGDHRELFNNMLVVTLMVVLALFYNLITALFAGVVVASVLFTSTISKNIIRRICYGDSVHSKKIRDHQTTEILKEKGRRICLLEIDGPVFFGSTEKLFKTIAESAQDSSYLILDLKRVSQIDTNGVHFFRHLAEKIRQQGNFLLLSGLSAGNSVSLFNELDDVGKPEHPALFVETDAALAWAEDHLLFVKMGLPEVSREIPFAELDIVDDFTSDQIQRFRAKLIRQNCKKGEYVVREGDNEKSAFFLTSGLVSVVIGGAGRQRSKRLATLSPGVVFGELALLEGRPRSADIIVDEDAVVYKLEEADFVAMMEHESDIAVKLLMNIDRTLARRVLSLNDELQTL